MKKFLFASLAAVSMMATLTATPQIQQTHLNVNATEYQYSTDGYLSYVSGILSWDDFFESDTFSRWSDAGDYMTFDGTQGLWDYNTDDWTFAQGGSVTIADLVTNGVIPATGDWSIDVSYNFASFGTVWLGQINAFALPDYIDQWVGIINTEEANRIVSYNSIPSRASILADLRAYDFEEGDVTLSITETTSETEKISYDTLSRGLSTYSLTFQAEDSNNNLATVTINITVIDTIAPTIIGPEYVTKSYRDAMPIGYLIGEYWSATDGYDGALSITAINDTYSPNISSVNTTPGYSVDLRVVDSSGNISTKTVYIRNIDDVDPILYGESFYTKGVNATLTLEDIKAGLIVDEVDPLVAIEVVSDNYTRNSTKTGSYYIEFQAVDTSGNRSEIYTVEVFIEDTNPPVFFIDGAVYTVDPGNVYTIEQLVTVLESDGTIDNTQDYSYEVVVDEYSDQASIAGSHKVVLNIKYASGAIQQVEMNIDVPEQLPVEDELPWWESAWNDFIEWAGNIISSIFGG